MEKTVTCENLHSFAYVNAGICTRPIRGIVLSFLGLSVPGMFSEDPLDEALCVTSPLHLADRMPDVEYTLFHCDADKSVNKEMHSDRFATAMRGKHRITYIEIPGRGHCDLPPEEKERYLAAAADAILR